MRNFFRSAFKHVRPLTLREWLYWRAQSRLGPQADSAFKRAPLALAPGIFLDLEPGDIMHKIIAGTGVYGSPVSVRIARLAKRGGLLVDVGANYGYFSAIWAAGISSNKTVAFEALPENAKALKRNVLANGLGPRVEIVQKAVSNKPGTMYFDKGPDGQTGQGGLVPSGVETPLKVEVVTLDEYFATRAHPIEVLKIDVEGADTLVLEGAEKLLSRGLIEHIFFEFYGERMEYLGIPRNKPFDLLARHGYKVSRVAKGEFYAKAPAQQA